jgi:DNA sulfur modification protein DndC
VRKANDYITRIIIFHQYPTQSPFFYKSFGMSTKNLIDTLSIEIQEQYLSDNTPWVLGYSGGKDSTTVANLVLYALSKLPQDQLKKEVHILSNDTLVENPAIVEYVDGQLDLIRKAGKAKVFAHHPDLFQTVKVAPKLDDRFWVNLIGKGYPSPNRWFRWCTDRMKINPTNDYILKQVSKHGKAIIVLGTRSTESANRAKSMKEYDLGFEGMKFRKHSLPNAWVYAPIHNWETGEVWEYLMSVPSFWGGDHKKLVTLYRNASPNASECPLVIDTSTPSCGTSRFGCWVCTVVDKDKSMENLIENGEEWMEPLLEFRDMLAEIRNDETKRFDKSDTYTNRKGAFLFEVRADLLERLLKIETDIQAKTGTELITKAELAAIQLQWQYQGNFEFSVAEIYEKAKGKKISMMNSLQKTREEEELELLREVSKEHQVNPDHIRALMVMERDHAAFLRRKNILDDMQKKIEKFATETVEQ